MRLPSRCRSPRSRKWLTMIAALGLPLAFGVAYLGWTYDWINATPKGYAAPPFVLPDYEGRPVALADYLGRKPVVLVFYMTYGHCRAQLWKLRAEVGRIRSLGAEVMAISSDRSDNVRRMATELGFAFPVLSNPSLDVIYRYSMKSQLSTMADMGYVLIDAAGRVRLRQIDHRFGEHGDEIVDHLRGMTQTKAGSP